MPKAYLETSEVQKLEQSATNLRDKLLIKVLFHLGCRISEALSLKIEDIDFAQDTVTIEHLKSHIKLSCPQCDSRLGKGHAFCPKCGVTVGKSVTKEEERCRMRTLPLDSESLDMLREYIKRGGPINKGDELLIFGINRHRAWQIIKDCAERAGLPKMVSPETGKVHNVSPHKLRDAFAVRAVKQDDTGDGLRLLQEHMGHANFNTTAKYRKIDGHELKEWYNKPWEKETKPHEPQTD